MANSTDKRRRSTINVARLTMWTMTSDTSSETAYGNTPLTWDKSLASVKYTPKIQSAEQYGDGLKVEDYIAKDGGDIEINVNGFEKGDAAFLFGETDVNGTEVSNADDNIPYVCAAYYTERSDGKINLYKFPKVKFRPEGEDSKQKEGSSVSYGTANLKGSYSPLISSGNDRYVRREVDPSTDSTIIESWFSDADYYGPAAAGQGD